MEPSAVSMASRSSFWLATYASVLFNAELNSVAGDDRTGPNVCVIQRTPSCPAVIVKIAGSCETPASCALP